MDEENGPAPRLDSRQAGPSVSDFRQPARLDQVHEDIPLLPLQDGQISRLTDPHLVACDLHLWALATTSRAQQYLEILHVSLASFLDTQV